MIMKVLVPTAERPPWHDNNHKRGRSMTKTDAIRAAVWHLKDVHSPLWGANPTTISRALLGAKAAATLPVVTVAEGDQRLIDECERFVKNAEPCAIPSKCAACRRHEKDGCDICHRLSLVYNDCEGQRIRGSFSNESVRHSSKKLSCKHMTYDKTDAGIVNAPIKGIALTGKCTSSLTFEGRDYSFTLLGASGGTKKPATVELWIGGRKAGDFLLNRTSLVRSNRIDVTLVAGVQEVQLVYASGDKAYLSDLEIIGR
jgi:hypothetical protein